MKIVASGNNYTEIEHEGKNYCQSYKVIIAMLDGGKVYLDERYWCISPTTSKHLNIFLNLKSGEAAKKVKSGEYAFGGFE